MQSLFRNKKRVLQRGFTLIELLVVISIISLVASVVLASVKVAQAKARDSRRTQDVVQFKNALELYSLDHAGKYPIVPADIVFTSKGIVARSTTGNTVDDPIICGTGRAWGENAGSYSSDWATFDTTMKPYIKTFPTDPGGKDDNCYVYVSNDTGTVAALVTSYEAPERYNTHVGIIVGNPDMYSLIPNVPAISIVVGNGTISTASSTTSSSTSGGGGSSLGGGDGSVYGCTEVDAFNYDVSATIDDNSCIAKTYGCTDPTAQNYDSYANTDDTSCAYVTYGCTDPGAINFNPSADLLPTWIDNPCIYPIYGCTDPGAGNYDPNANTDDGSCSGDASGCTDPGAYNYNPGANMDDGSCVEAIAGCMDSSASNYNPSANTGDGSDCIWYGCTDPNASNVSSQANVDDGSCTY